jgi:hypothetical protein
MKLRTPFLLLLLTAAPALATAPAGFGLEVIVDGAPRPEYAARGTVYVEALRGRDFSLRLKNPLGVRVAVALSVDGLNTIDARHTSAAVARKWVLDPYESVEIPGWQVSGETSRKFYFAGERHSYGAALGQTSNLGTIEAVFFREKAPCRDEQPCPSREGRISSKEKDGRGDGAPLEPGLDGALGHSMKSSSPDVSVAKGELGQAEPSTMAPDHSQKSFSSSSPLSDDLAATGMGRRTRFDVTRVTLELEETPAASVRLRYEFRPQLVALGVLPREIRDPIARREAARGFDDFCPEPR